MDRLYSFYGDVMMFLGVRPQRTNAHVRPWDLCRRVPGISPGLASDR
jgi:hypothetical protein